MKAGRTIKECLDCGHEHGTLEICACGCVGSVDVNSTLYCPTCLGPLPTVFGVEHECERAV